jgi:hypothetical protein
MAWGWTSGDMTMDASSSASTIVNGGGLALTGLRFSAGVTGTGFYLKEGASATDLAKIYDSAGSQVAITLPAAAASSAVTVMLPPEKHYNMRYCQVVGSSAQSSAVTITPLWAKLSG